MNRLVKTAKDEWKKWLRGTTVRKEMDEDGLYRNDNIQYLFNRMSTVTYAANVLSSDSLLWRSRLLESVVFSVAFKRKSQTPK